MIRQSISLNNHFDSNTLQQDLDTLQTWERLWDMDFNLSKCQVLHISKSRHPAQHIYMLHGQVLEAMDHAKYLGVDISKDLSWNTQINRISTNANRTLGFLKGTSRLKHSNPHSCIPNAGLPSSRIRIHSMEPFHSNLH